MSKEVFALQIDSTKAAMQLLQSTKEDVESLSVELTLMYTRLKFAAYQAGATGIQFLTVMRHEKDISSAHELFITLYTQILILLRIMEPFKQHINQYRKASILKLTWWNIIGKN